MAWVAVANWASLTTLINNSEKLGGELEENIEGDEGEDVEGDGGEEVDSSYEVAVRPTVSKRQHSHLDDDEGMPPLHSSTRLARLINSSPVKTLDSASELTGLIFEGNPEPKYFAIAPTAIPSTLSVEDQKPFFGATHGDFAWISPLFVIILVWLVIFHRARKQRRAGRMDCELVGRYLGPKMEMKGDLESGSV